MDVEAFSSKKHRVNGYPSLAAFIASDKDQSTSIYRSFKRSSARNLLYLEAEISELEAQQDTYDDQDLHGDLEAKKCARSWPEFVSRTNDPRQKERLEVVMRMRRLMREYREYMHIVLMTHASSLKIGGAK